MSTDFSLRVSVLEQCQFNCPYCLPGSVNAYTKKSSWISSEEYAVIARLLSEIRIDKIRFTGGEPLLRKDLPEIISSFRSAMPNSILALTTNGKELASKYLALAKAGIDLITIHIDTLHKDRYQTYMGHGDPHEIIMSIKQMKSHFKNLKINMVVQKDKNDDELLDFLELSQSIGIEVRFIELMNTGSATNYVSRHFISGKNIIEKISQHYSVKPIPRRSESDPARLFQLENSGLIFGLIASDTQPFCSACNRLRLTTDGQLKGCLYQQSGVNLASLIRQNVNRHDLDNKIVAAISQKKSYHPEFSTERNFFSMADIGG